MVVKTTLIVVSDLRVRLIAEQTVGQFQQVVCAAALTVVARQVLRLRLGFK